MSLLNRIFGGSDDEEEDDGPSPKDIIEFRLNLSDQHTHRRVLITYDDGTTEKLYYDKSEQDNGVRTYYEISDWEGTKTYRTSWYDGHDNYGIEYEYEQVKEVVVENVRSFEILKETSYSYQGRYEDKKKREDYEYHEERYETEVLHDPAEDDEDE